jgi:hypothetical protein
MRRIQSGNVMRDQRTVGPVLGRFLLAWIVVLASVNSWGQEKANPPDRSKVMVQVTRPVHPLLVRNEQGPMLRVALDVAKGDAVRLASLEFSLDGTDDLGDIDSLRLFHTRAADTFSATSSGGRSQAARQDNQVVSGSAAG